MNIRDFFPAGIQRLFADLTICGESPRLIGGAVRDALLGRQPRDYDFITRADAGLARAVLIARGWRCGAIHFGSFTAAKCGIIADITETRAETYFQPRFPQTRRTASFAEDARRRDFTVNALAADASGRIYDYCGGAADLAARRVRFIGNAAESLRNDPSRAARAEKLKAVFAAAEVKNG